MQDAYFTLIYHEHEKLPKDLNVSQILIKHKLSKILFIIYQFTVIFLIIDN